MRGRPIVRTAAGVALAGLMLAGLAGAGAAPKPARFAPPDPADRIALRNGRWTQLEQGCPTLPDAGLRQRIVDVAAEEWARFGYPVEEARETGLSVVYRPLHGEIIPRRFNKVSPGLTRRGMRLGWMEDDRAVAAAIGGYWTAAPDEGAIDIQNRLRAVYSATGWAVPWSAAFVSYVVCAAGVGDMDRFARSDSHFTYVDQAIAATDGRSRRAIYRARDVAAGLPRPGDLLCADRRWPTPLRTLADRRANPGERPMHCDVVVKVDRPSGYVAVIGGNVSQSVNLTMVNIVAGAKGRPDRVQTSADISGARPYFAVLSLGIGGAASLDRTPAIARITGG
jgi:uncharacterized protein DUF2272